MLPTHYEPGCDGCAVLTGFTSSAMSADQHAILARRETGPVHINLARSLPDLYMNMRVPGSRLWMRPTAAGIQRSLYQVMKVPFLPKVAPLDLMLDLMPNHSACTSSCSSVEMRRKHHLYRSPTQTQRWLSLANAPHQAASHAYLLGCHLLRSRD